MDTFRVAVIELLVAALATGCSAAVGPGGEARLSGASARASFLPSDSITPSPTVQPPMTPGPATTPRPTIPVFTDRADAKAERDGIVFELWLSGAVAPTHRRLFAQVRVTNGSTRTIHRQVGGNCGNVASIIVDQRELLEKGRPWTGIAATFKQQVVEERQLGQSAFETVRVIDLPRYGCADFFGLEKVPSGSVLEQMYAWDANGRFGNPVVPGGATVRATFAYYADADHADPSDERKVSIATNIRVDGEETRQRWLTDYIDKALSQPRFRDWLDDEPTAAWINTSVVNWPNENGEYPEEPVYQKATEGTVDIGLFRRDEENGEYGGVILDLPSGELLGLSFEECC